MVIPRALLAAGHVVPSVGTAAAEDVPACASFARSVARERAAFLAPDLPALASGAALERAGAGRLALKPAAETGLPIPSGKPSTPETFAGSATATMAAAETCQVTLSNDAWIDAGQDGRSALAPTVHSVKAGCPDVRKSVRIRLDAGPVTIAISRAPDPQIERDLVMAE